MTRYYLFCVALLWSVAPAVPAATQELPPDVLFYSADDQGLSLGDETTTIGSAEVAILDRNTKTYATLHVDGFMPCGGNDTSYFGGVSFFEELGSPGDEDIDIDALYIHPWGNIVFSTTRSFTSTQLGTVKDGDVVELNPFVPGTDPAALRYVIQEDLLFPDIELESEQDVIFYSVTSSDGVILGDDDTRLTKSEVAVAYATDVPALSDVPYTKAPDRIAPMYPNGFAVCGQQVVVRFGGDEFFDALGATDKVSIDAFHVLPSGHVAFSTASDFKSTLLGTVRDGSVVVFNPYVPFDDDRSLRYLIDEQELLAELIAASDGTDDIDAFAIHDGKYYLSFSKAVTMNGAGGEALEVGDSDIVEYDPAGRGVRVFASADTLFSELSPSYEIDIDGLSFDRRGHVIFSTRQPAPLTDDFVLADGALGAYDPATGTTRVYALQSHLFASGEAVDADISAVHIEVGRKHGDECSSLRVDKGLVNNNQDINAFTIAADGTFYLSIEKSEAVLNGPSTDPLIVRDGDIVEYNIGTNVARIVHAESELFSAASGSPGTDIDALSLDESGSFVFSVAAPAVLEGADSTVDIDDSSLALWDQETGEPVVYAAESGELFGADIGDLANLNALHVGAPCPPLAAP